MQGTQLAALVAARKQLDLIVQSTTHVVLAMGLVFLLMVPFFSGLMDNMALLISILIVAGMLLGYLFKKRSGYLREYHQLMQRITPNEASKES